MHRCIELARRGAGHVAPNPLVGAVLVYENKIIGEGWHQQYGQAHAEVNCINSAIQKGYSDKVHLSTLYVSLEPCAHYGKTPPCADLIIHHKIPKVVIGCRDPFKEVNGKGIEKLRQAGVKVQAGILEEECIELNKRFFTFHIKHRPYIVLKWAQTADGFIASSSANDRLLISNEYSNRLVHQWRSEEAAILVGTNTALYDNPELTTRHWDGPSPIRLVVDMQLKLPASLKIFNDASSTIIFNTLKHSDSLSQFQKTGGHYYYQVSSYVNLVDQILNGLYQLGIQSVLVEGGAILLQSFIDQQAWDEARVIVNKQLFIGNGLPAPVLENTMEIKREQLKNDDIRYYKPA